MKNEKIKNAILFVIPVAFYVFFAIYDGVVLQADSATYIELRGYVDPLYPLFIGLNQFIFKNNSLVAAVIEQSIITAITTWILASYISKEFNLNNIFSLLVEFLLLSVSLLCRFASKRGFMYSNCILTEALAYPLFILFFRFITEYVLTGNKKSFILTSVFCFLGLCTRKQMLVMLCVLFCAVIYHGIKNKKLLKGIISVSIVLFAIVGLTKCVDLFYMSSFNDLDGTHTGGSRFFASMVIYGSEREAINNIEDESLRQAFLGAYDECDAKGYLMHNEHGTWFEKLEQYGENYDHVQLDVTWPRIKEYVHDELGLEGTVADVKVDELLTTITKSLLIPAIPSLIYLIFRNILAGLFITVSAEKSIFIVYSIIIYSIYLISLIYLLIKEGFNKYTLFGLLVLLSILINVAGISLIIFCQTRYTMYNLGLFYIALFIMLYRLYSIKKQVK